MMKHEAQLELRGRDWFRAEMQKRRERWAAEDEQRRRDRIAEEDRLRDEAAAMRQAERDADGS